MMTASMDADLDDVLEDSLTYSPLKDTANKENTPASFMNSLDRVRQSPSTARLFALLGGNQSNILNGESPRGLKPKRLEELLNTPVEIPSDAAKPPRCKEDLAAELRTLRSSMLMIQRDCEFHRKRALAAQDEVDNLNKYIQSLEEERKSRQSPDFDPTQISIPPLPPIDSSEIRELKLTITSLETLNKSLSRQNDLLRSRPSLSGNRFTGKESSVQTDLDCATDRVGEASPSSPSPFKMPLYTPPPSFTTGYMPKFTRKEISIQTETGVWATVEDLSDRPLSRRIVSLGSRDQEHQYIPLPAPKVDLPIEKRARKSLPSDFSPTECLFKGIATVQTSKAERAEPELPFSKVSRQRERVRKNETVSHEVPRSRRGVSTGSVSSARQRSDSSKRIWIP